MKDNKERPPRTITTVKTSGVSSSTLLIVFLIWIITLILITSS